MKISLIGLSGCGKTSIYLTTLGGMVHNKVKKLSPTIMYDVRNHNYLGLQISLWDFGGQEKYREAYLESPEVLANTTVLICVLDLHCPQDFNDAKTYFEDVYSTIKQNGGNPITYIFYHKYDTEDYPNEQLQKNLAEAKALSIFPKLKPVSHLTSIYKQNKLSEIMKQILIADFENLRHNVEQAQKSLQELHSKIIVCDINGNIVTHNIRGFTTGMKLREDLWDYISGCNILRETFLTTKSAKFSAKSHEKKLDLYIFSYILCVLIVAEENSPTDPQEYIDNLLNEMQIFADLIIEADKAE
ncbi:MAG: ADP-ribosylation factor-like protein [Candidatus Hodarchaeota archaeon]